MVTTRSGKPVYPVCKPGAPASRSKPAKQAIVIFDDTSASANPSVDVSKKRESPCKLAKVGVKKAKANNFVEDKENSHNVAPLPVGHHSEVKKIQISEDEKQMNGAPEGDLFEMVVFEDSELWPFANDVEAADELGKGISKHKGSSVWAEKYEALVVMRRVLLHHTDIVDSDAQHLTGVVAAAVEDVDSLRSCRVRNGIICLRTLVSTCSVGLTLFNTAALSSSSSSSSASSMSLIGSVTNCLLAKTGGGPRFISELALNTLLNSAVPHLEPLLLVSCLAPSVGHRNAELASSAILAMVGCVRRIDVSVLASSSEECMASLRDLCQGLSLALNAKRPKAKEEARTTFRSISATVGEEHFHRLLALHLTETQSKEVLRATSSIASTAPSTPAVSMAGTPASGSHSTLGTGAGVAGVSSVFRGPPGSAAVRGPPVGATARPGGACRLPPSGQTSGVSKFRLHMQAQAAAAAASASAGAAVGSTVGSCAVPSSVERSAVRGACSGLRLVDDLEIVCAAPSATPTVARGDFAPAAAMVAAPRGGSNIAVREALPLPASAAPASDAAPTLSAVATPAPSTLSLRDHIQLMKQQKRLAAQQAQQAQKESADALDVLITGAQKQQDSEGVCGGSVDPVVDDSTPGHVLSDRSDGSGSGNGVENQDC